MKYKIYFKIYDKKMQATIEANTKEQAEYLLRGKLEVVKIEEVVAKENINWNNCNIFDTLRKMGK